MSTAGMSVGAEGCECGEWVSPSQLGEGSEKGAAPREKFSIFRLKIAIFGAFWAAIFTVQRTALYADHAD